MAYLHWIHNWKYLGLADVETVWGKQLICGCHCSGDTCWLGEKTVGPLELVVVLLVIVVC